MKSVTLAVLAFVCANYAHSQAILTDNTQGQVVHNISHFRTFDTLDIRQLESKEFELLDSDNASFGYDKATHWYRFEVANRSSRTEWFLEIAAPLLDHVEFYSISPSGKWDLQYSGDLYKISTRVVHHKNLVFPFYIKRGTKESFYIKVVTTSAIQLPLTIWSAEGLRNSIYSSQFANGLFYGIIMIMIAYNLFLFISIRDKTILYYVVALIAGGIVIGYFNGYGFFYLNPELPELNRIVGALASPLFIISSVALTRSFLELKRFSFWLDRTLMAISVVAVIFALLKFGLGDYMSHVPVRLLSLINFSMILVSAVYCLMRHFRPARYFLLAWVTILVLGILLLLRNVGFVERSWIVDNSLYFGGVLQVLLISFAFGDRFNVLQKENLEAKERALLLEHQEKERLELEVNQRTEEIRLKNAQLEESNNIKNKLFSIVSHDLRGPLISLQGVLDLASIDSLSPEDIKKFTDKVGVRLHHTAEFLDNLLQWSRVQMQGETFVMVPERFSLQDLLISSTQVLRSEADRKNIRLTIDVPPVDVYADMNMMQTVVRNLVSNALKFTYPGGKVELTATLKDGFVAVRISDNGVGISRDVMQKLFTLVGVTKPGTQLEKGTGIGLVVCKEFVERNGGTIGVESTIGEGTTFEFTIPH
jgi:signal transduction histidine kinase